MTQTVLVTGCSSGIGRDCIAQLKAKNIRVIASARKPQDVAALQNEGFEAILLDVSEPKRIEQAMAELDALGVSQIDGLVNNAGFAVAGALEDLTFDDLSRQFATNVFGLHQLTAAIIPKMRAQGFGRIVFVSSVLGFVAMPYRGAYNASKYAVEGLADTLRQELAGSGITVSLIQPGPIESKFRENAYQSADHDRFAGSFHRKAYGKLAKQAKSGASRLPFSKEPSAVSKVILHALLAKHPKARYRVTFPTHLFACLKRCLPTKALDWLLRRVA